MHELGKLFSIIQRYSLMYYQCSFENNGISGGQHMFGFLVCKHPGITQEQLSAVFAMNKSTVTRAVNQLYNDGYITKERDEADKRIYHIYPTGKLQQIYPYIVEKLSEWEGILTNNLTKEEVKQLESLLSKVGQNVLDYFKNEKTLL